MDGPDIQSVLFTNNLGSDPSSSLITSYMSTLSSR